jgi:hypothetical protein
MMLLLIATVLLVHVFVILVTMSVITIRNVICEILEPQLALSIPTVAMLYGTVTVPTESVYVTPDTKSIVTALVAIDAQLAMQLALWIRIV